MLLLNGEIVEVMLDSGEVVDGQIEVQENATRVDQPIAVIYHWEPGDER